MRFQVSAETKDGELVFITGNSPKLGKWDPNEALIMTKDDESLVWSLDINLDGDYAECYRYFIGTVLTKSDELDNPLSQVVVNRWETNLFPRRINSSLVFDHFGDYGGSKQVNVGCLTDHHAALISIGCNGVKWFKKKFRNEDFSILMTPLHLDESEATRFEIAVLDRKNFSDFKCQQDLGHMYDKSEFLLFRNYFIEGLPGIRIEFHGANSVHRFATSFMLFGKKSSGSMLVPITDHNSRIIGNVEVRYSIIKPMNHHKFNLEFGECTNFQHAIKKGIHVGHRGAGIMRRNDTSDNLLENTISSLNYAVKHGADMVEFDVILTKDKVPVLYHDFSVNLSLAKKFSGENEKLEIHIRDLTYQQLKILKLGPIKRQESAIFEFFDTDCDDNQPFCSLEQVLKQVSPCSFNIEIKYPTGTDTSFDLNDYVDCILDTVFEFQKSRDIIISSFDPDICALVRIKQAKLPVLFLTEGLNEKDREESDDRLFSVEMACYYASAMKFSGVNCDAKRIIENRSLAKFVLDAELLLFCYGNDIKDGNVIEDLIKVGVHGLIYDKIDVISPKKSQSDENLAQNGEQQQQTTTTTTTTSTIPATILDVVRNAAVAF